MKKILLFLLLVLTPMPKVIFADECSDLAIKGLGLSVTSESFTSFCDSYRALQSDIQKLQQQNQSLTSQIMEIRMKLAQVQNIAENPRSYLRCNFYSTFEHSSLSCPAGQFPIAGPHCVENCDKDDHTLILCCY